jgi:hypothetical protein
MKRLSPEQITEINDRRYNTLKMRMTLLKVDAILRLQLLLWIPFILVVLFCYGFVPSKYPLHSSLIWSTGFYLTHYVLVGLVRRMAETYLGKLCAHSGNERCKDLSVFENESLKPYKRADDPLLVRRAFAFTGALGLPSRGLGQMSVASFHFFVLITYIANYLHYFGHPAVQFTPASVYLLHGVVTGGGLLMIIKNAGYLISSQHILVLLRGIIDWKKLGREHDHLEHEEHTAEEAIGDSMKQYRFEDNKPPVPACHRCVTNMAKHVADEVPMVVLPNIEKKELLAKLLKLRERSPEFAEALKSLLERLEQDPANADSVFDEFKAILLRSPDLVRALHALDSEPEDKDPQK